DGLKQEVLKHRGKVVIVDFWATNCPPCMKSFPKFIKMHEKYADKGLVVIAVSIDPVEEDNLAVNLANKFLTQSKSPFINLLLDEPKELMAKQLDYVSLPFYYVFDRRGKWMRYRAYDYADKKEGLLYEDLEAFAVQALNEK